MSRITRAVGKSDVFMPAVTVGMFVGFASNTWMWGVVAALAMMFVLSEIANLKDEIRKRG